MRYSDSLDDVTDADLAPFFVGWKPGPSPAQRLEALRQSYRVVLAWEDDHLVGFISAISDGVLAAYIPLLEVLPGRQHAGIGSELTRRMLELLGDLYMVDLVCDPNLAPFYERQGMARLTGMAIRNRSALAG